MSRDNCGLAYVNKAFFQTVGALSIWHAAEYAVGEYIRLHSKKGYNNGLT